jgi:hypothetical protein
MLRSIAGAVVGEVIGRKRGNGLLGAGIGLVATRIATRSVPGLLLVGGAIAAKTIYDMRKERKAISPSANTPSLPPATPSRSRLAKPASER